MMTTTGKLKVLDISRNGVPITVLNKYRAFTLDGQSYDVRPTGTFVGSYELHRGDETLAVAKGEPFVNRMTVTHGDKSWLFKPENFRASRFGLYDGATRLGGVTPAGGLRGWLRPWHGATIDLPDALPLYVQVFLTSIVLFKWVEQSSST
jgi:hypothetical protein